MVLSVERSEVFRKTFFFKKNVGRTAINWRGA